MNNLTVFIILALTGWGLWGIFDKKALSHNTPWQTILITYTWYLPICIITLWITSIYFPNKFPSLESSVWLWTALAALINWLSIIAYLQAMRQTEASYVIGMTAGYPVLMQFIATLILHEDFVPLRLIGSLLISAGIFVIGLSKNEQQKSLKRNDWIKMSTYIILATIGWGLVGIFDKIALNNSPPLTAFCASITWNAALCFIAIAVSWLMQIKIKRPTTQSWFYPSFSALALTLASIGYLGALSVATASYVIVITSCYPLLTFFLATKFLGEPMNYIRMTGIILVIFGGIFTQFTATT